MIGNNVYHYLLHLIDLSFVSQLLILCNYFILCQENKATEKKALGKKEVFVVFCIDNDKIRIIFPLLPIPQDQNTF